MRDRGWSRVADSIVLMAEREGALDHRKIEYDRSSNLQNADELHFNIGDHFWMEWFPCGDEEMFELYCRALTTLYVHASACRGMLWANLNKFVGSTLRFTSDSRFRLQP